MESRQWTHPSVLAFAAGRDPIEAITERAQTEALRAIEKGWRGPPFDPFQLANLLEVDVVAREELDDARTVPVGRDAVRIEYNPNRPAGRLRFSLAHEIAHTFFPDVAAAVRNRTAGWVGPADWQLELLCNVAASELLMPAGHLDDVVLEPLDINRLMERRKAFDVSTEAFLRRVVKLTDQSATFFAASRTHDAATESDFRIDYVVLSRAAQSATLQRRRLTGQTILSECVAVGYTARKRESWPGVGDCLVECVGIPGYPGRRYPRVVGLLLPRRAKRHAAHEIQYLFGDATQPRGDGVRIIGHIVNDRTPNWGGPFARALKARFPRVQDEFRQWVSEDRSRLALGATHIAETAGAIRVATMIAQHGYGPSAGPRIRYLAVRQCLRQLAEEALRLRGSVHLPRVGAGEAGGRWTVIEELIDQELCRTGVPVTVYSLPDASMPERAPSGEPDLAL